MGVIPELLAISAVLIGTLFSLTGVLGYLRMPDVYSRLHATGKVGVFGGVLLAIASAMIGPGNFGRAMILILMLLLIGPSLSHALAEAAVRANIRPEETTKNRQILETLESKVGNKQSKP